MSATAATVTEPSPAPAWEERPPGERYYRHPGDVVRCIGWSGAALALALFITVATGTSDGVRADLGGAITAVPTAARQLLVVIAQIAAVITPIAVVGVLAWQRRWRRLATVVGAACLGAALWWLIEQALDEPAAIVGSLADDSWLVSSRFPSRRRAHRVLHRTHRRVAVAVTANGVAPPISGWPGWRRRWRSPGPRGSPSSSCRWPWVVPSDRPC